MNFECFLSIRRLCSEAHHLFEELPDLWNQLLHFCLLVPLGPFVGGTVLSLCVWFCWLEPSISKSQKMYYYEPICELSSQTNPSTSSLVPSPRRESKHRCHYVLSYDWMAALAVRWKASRHYLFRTSLLIERYSESPFGHMWSIFRQAFWILPQQQKH